MKDKEEVVDRSLLDIDERYANDYLVGKFLANKMINKDAF